MNIKWSRGEAAVWYPIKPYKRYPEEPYNHRSLFAKETCQYRLSGLWGRLECWYRIKPHEKYPEEPYIYRALFVKETC